MRITSAILFLSLAACGTTTATTASDTPKTVGTPTPSVGLGKLTAPAQVDCDVLLPWAVTRDGVTYPAGTVRLGYTQILSSLDHRLHAYAKVTAGDVVLTGKEAYAGGDAGSLASLGFVAITDGDRTWPFEFHATTGTLFAGDANAPGGNLQEFSASACHAVEYSNAAGEATTVVREAGNASIESYAGINGSPSPMDFVQ